MFDELFPRSASHFDASVITTDDWKRGIEDDSLTRMWTVSLYADDLLRRAASFRGTGDVFLTGKFYSKLALLRREIADMAGRKVRDAIKDNDKAEWKGFLDFRLTDELLAELDGWKPKPADIWTEVDAMIADGYRLILSYNAKTHLASCTVICDANTKAWGGWALSSSDEDGALALKMAIFKHLHLQRDWSGLLGQPQAKGRRG